MCCIYNIPTLISYTVYAHLISFRRLSCSLRRRLRWTRWTVRWRSCSEAFWRSTRCSPSQCQRRRRAPSALFHAQLPLIRSSEACEEVLRGVRDLLASNSGVRCERHRAQAVFRACGALCKLSSAHEGVMKSLPSSSSG